MKQPEKSSVGGLAVEGISTLIQQAKKNQEKLLGCDGHQFVPTDPHHFGCLRCSGQVNELTHALYEQGRRDTTK